MSQTSKPQTAAQTFTHDYYVSVPYAGTECCFNDVMHAYPNKTPPPWRTQKASADACTQEAQENTDVEAKDAQEDTDDSSDGYDEEYKLWWEEVE